MEPTKNRTHDNMDDWYTTLHRVALLLCSSVSHPLSPLMTTVFWLVVVVPPR